MTMPAFDRPAGWNWARNHEFSASVLHQPTSVDQLVHVVSGAAARNVKVRTIGSRHSFTDIADSAEMIDLARLPERFELSADGESVVVCGSMIYSRLGELLLGPAMALANLASLPHLSVAGAVSTGTHGSGSGNRNLAGAVRALEIATTSGVVRVARGEPDFAAAAVSLGAMGPIVSVELDLEPEFLISQEVHDRLSWACVDSAFESLFDSAYSVSLFTDWSSDGVQLWTKRRTDQSAIDHSGLHDGTAADVMRHPVMGESPDACTRQLGEPGLWSERLPHFRAGATPSVGAEIQSEFFVARADAVQAIEQLRLVGPDLADTLLISEIRAVASDSLWLSPQFERDSIAFHFTWRPDNAGALRAARIVADALSPFAPRPHWGKVFPPDWFDPRVYSRLDDALEVFSRWDPAETFTNDWLERTLRLEPDS